MKQFFVKLKVSLKSINYKLFFALLFTGLLPTIYTTVRIFFIGQMPSDSGYSIASQMQWVNVLYEIIQEMFILPLYFFIGMAFGKRELECSTVEQDGQQYKITNMVRTGLVILFAVYTLLSAIIILFCYPLVKFMGQDQSILSQTVNYIRLETVANIFYILFRFVLVVVVTIKKSKYLYILLCLQIVLIVLFDTFLISNFKVSAKLGVNGIAITNIVVNLLLFALSIWILYKENINIFKKERLNFKWAKGLFKVGGLSGLESFVRNVVFMLMVVRIVNQVGGQGTFWVANNFIYGWLLLPVVQLGELVKRDCGDSKDAIRDKLLGYFLLTTVFVLLWFVSMPFWQTFMRVILQLDNYNQVFYIVLISIGFYVLFAYNNVLDSIFYGIGKTNYMLLQSLIINIVFYGIVFVLNLTGVFVATLTSIALMFASGIALDSILTYIIFVRMIKKQKIKLW